MSMDYVAIGKRIKKLREEKNYTQEQLAEFLDVSNAYISKIERGKTTLNLNTLSSICDYLGEKPAFILEGCKIDSESYLRNEITDMINGCSPEKVKLIANVIKCIMEYDKSKN